MADEKPTPVPEIGVPEIGEPFSMGHVPPPSIVICAVPSGTDRAEAGYVPPSMPVIRQGPIQTPIAPASPPPPPPSEES
jgi:hypothetical protein